MEGLQNDWTFEELEHEIPDLNEYHYKKLWNDLSSPTGYYANFPILQTTNINKSDLESNVKYRNAIVEINVYDWSWTYSEDSARYAYQNIRLKWHANYHHCYTLQIPENQLKVNNSFRS
jgi:hypothetical protein